MKIDKNCSPAHKKSLRHSDSASSDHRSPKFQIEKQPLKPERVRKINGSFAFIEHRFLRNGFWDSLQPEELLMYILLVLVADRNGLSYYSYDKICTLVGLTLDEYIRARDNLIDKDLIAFDGRLFQVLSLPDHAPKKEPCTSSHNPEMIRQIISRGLGHGRE
ncbi:MAG: helix-turn-helix domain-containing protein [Desulfovibrionales bacterium]|nr:helix-turn-helix domain-containing protein [Desulfovibrionales bacterium]